MIDQQHRDAQIYAMYLQMKGTKQTVNNIAKKFSCTRIAVYDAINRVEQGNQQMILKELVDARNEILWKYQFKALWLTLKKGTTPAFKEERIVVVKRMIEAGFPKTLIATKTGLARSTVETYLK